LENDPLIEARNLAVGYHGKAVLSDLNFDLKQGTFAILLGSNGSGKSTLLKTLAGILPPLQGTFVYLPDGRPHLGYVPQKEGLDSIFLFTALEIVQMGTLARVKPGKWISREEKEFARHCLEQTGATPFEQKQFSTLSGGQKQRVLIARALAAKPRVLLLDEPTSGIDASGVADIMEVLKNLHLKLKLTVLMVTHDLGAVQKHASEVFWINNGILTCGTAEALFSAEKIKELLALKIC